MSVCVMLVLMCVSFFFPKIYLFLPVDGCGVIVWTFFGNTRISLFIFNHRANGLCVKCIFFG
jgi:hypothetical protein